MAEFDVPFSPPTFDVYRLEQETGHEEDTVISVKLTDECLTAIAAAHKKKHRLKLEVDAQGGGTVRIGDVSFRFSTQPLPPPPTHTDAVSYQPSIGFKSRASVGLKYTIQATQNSFEETRVKAQKLMEEEKSRGTKDVNKSRSGKKTEVGRGLSRSHVAAALAHARASSLGVNKQNTSSVLGGGGAGGSRNASPNMNPAASAAAAQARTASMRSDLMKKGLRERIIHICVTMRYKSFEEVMNRLRKDGLTKEQQDDMKNIEDIFKEVSEITGSGRVILKPAFHGEVNIKWQWLSSEEKDHIRPILRPNPSNALSGSFAPSRKSGVDRMKAGVGGNNSNLNTSTTSSSSADRIRDNESRSSGSSSASTTSSPEAAPSSTSPPKGSSSSSSFPSLPKGSSSTSTSSSSIPLPSGKKRPAVSPLVEKEGDHDEDLYYSSTTSSKRKAHAPSGKTVTTPPLTTTSTMMGDREKEKERERSSLLSSRSSSSRPVRQESASPPEDPTMAKEEAMEGRDGRRGGSERDGRGKASKTTSVSPRPLPPSLAPPTHMAPPPSRTPSTSPRTDWASLYGAVSKNEEAEKYTIAFTACYAEYAESHAKLSKVADEFTAMEKELTACQRGSREADQVESKIQAKYSYYEKDVDFIKLRNRHADLRSKLMTIRSRLDSWENRRL